MKRSVLQLFCIVCLLLGQQAAFTHASWHAQEQSLRQHGNHHKQPSTQGDLCKLHGVFTHMPIVNCDWAVMSAFCTSL